MTDEGGRAMIEKRKKIDSNTGTLSTEVFPTSPKYSSSVFFQAKLQLQDDTQ